RPARPWHPGPGASALHGRSDGLHVRARGWRCRPLGEAVRRARGPPRRRVRPRHGLPVRRRLSVLYRTLDRRSAVESHGGEAPPAAPGRARVTVDLATKLRRLDAHARTAPSRPPRPQADPAAVLGGRYVRTAEGECLLVERRVALVQQGTGPQLAAARHVSCSAQTVFRRGAPGELDLNRAVFLDTETTGLSGGTGTYAFLVGLAFFDGDDVVIQQYFMRHPGEEPALLTAIREPLAAFPIWVTFNGKAFDVPLLQTPYRYGRRACLPEPTFHLDMLHPARRLWRNRLPSCSLATLERALLGVARRNDVPSWLIPSVYFDFVRRGTVDPLRAVFSHNAQDLLSLAALVGLVAQIVDEPPRYAGYVDTCALLRMYRDAGLAFEAESWVRAALSRAQPAEQGSLLWELAAILRRAVDLAGAARLWADLAIVPGPWA